MKKLLCASLLTLVGGTALADVTVSGTVAEKGGNLWSAFLCF